MISWSALSDAQRAFLGEVRAMGRELDCTPWLVGGAVRDLALNTAVGDLDLTVEGDAGRFAAALAERTGAQLIAHPRFLTYRLEVPGLEPVDVVTARREQYKQPGALPAVAPGTIEDDLQRRDFAANALAINLLKGELFDPQGGIGDLAIRALRVLHEKSFRDDPTRLFRGVRIGVRIGFHFDDRTERLAGEAARDQLLANVSLERLWREFDLALLEKSPGMVIQELSRRGYVEPLLGSPQQGELATGIDRIVAVATACDLNPKAAIIALFSPMHESLRHAGLSRKEIDGVNWFTQMGAGLIARLSATSCELRRLAMLQASGEIAALSVSAKSEELALTAQSWLRARRIHVSLDLAELKVPSGSERLIGRALLRARWAIALGTIPPIEGPAFARRQLIQYLQRDNHPIR